MKRKRFFIVLACLLVAALIIGCGDSGGDDNYSGTGDETGAGDGTAAGVDEELDWFISSCDDLDGVLTASGACFVECDSSDDCPTSNMRCMGTGVWITGQCEVDSGTRYVEGCGPVGWNDTGTGCYIKCSAEGNDEECPTGFRCIEHSGNSEGYFCTGYPGSSGGSCGTPCPDGCCSPSGRTCCKPPFCSGDCAYSKCCT